MDLVQKIKHLTELRDKRQKLKDELAELDHQIGTLEADIVEDMISYDLQSLKVDGLGTVVRSGRIYASVRQQDVDKAIEWLEQIGAGDISQRTINTQTLSAIIREKVEEGEQIPEFIKVYCKLSVSIRR